MTETPDLVVIAIDDEICVGIGFCEQLAPEAAQLTDEGFARPTGVQPTLAQAQELCAQCPTGAISIVS